MSSNTKCISGDKSSKEQPGSLEKMNVLIHKCSSFQRHPGQTVSKPGWDAEAGTQNKKKTRRLQRYLMRKALEQKGPQGPRSKEKNPGMTRAVSEMTRMQDSKDSKTNQLLQQVVVTTQKSSSTFCPDVFIPSVEQARQPSSSQGLQNRLTCPSLSTKSTSSFPCLISQKPGKCVAIDCEMVGTGPAGKTSELARCTVVSYDGDVIYDKYILPELPVVDYRTRWSGITWRHMRKAICFQVAQREIVQVLKDKIVVGHALHNDFRALKYSHPRVWTRDTSHCPLLKKKIALAPNPSMSLKNLATQLLHKKIQVDKRGHSSVEDAQASMELYRLVEFQWEQVLAPSLPLGPSDSAADGDTDNRCYMDDQYWPKDLDVDGK